MSSILLTACADKDFTDITVEMPESPAGNPVRAWKLENIIKSASFTVWSTKTTTNLPPATT